MREGRGTRNTDKALALELLGNTSPSAPFDMKRVRDGEQEVTGLGYPIDDGLWLFAALAAIAGVDWIKDAYRDLLDDADRERLDGFLGQRLSDRGVQ